MGCTKVVHQMKYIANFCEKISFLREKRNPEKSGPSWGLNPGPSEYKSMLLPIELLEPLGRGAVGKLYIATKPASSTCQEDPANSNCNYSLIIGHPPNLLDTTNVCTCTISNSDFPPHLKVAEVGDMGTTAHVGINPWEEGRGGEGRGG